MSIVVPKYFFLAFFGIILLYSCTTPQPSTPLRLSPQAVWPTLEDQIQRLERQYPTLLNYQTARTTLQTYLSSDNPEIAKGMTMLLQEPLFERMRYTEQFNPTLDGKNTEWDQTFYTAEDPAGDALTGRSDLDILKVSASLDTALKLSIMIQTQEAAYKDVVFEVFIGNTTTDTYDYYLQVALDAQGRQFVKLSTLNDRSTRIPFTGEVLVGEVLEAVIPLSDMGFSAETVPEELQVLTKVCDFRAQKPDESSVLYLAPGLPNHALLLLLALVEQNSFVANDVISIAIALAENSLFTIADHDTRQLILRDIQSRFAWYINTLEWQRTHKLPWSLHTAGLMPKLFWALRYSWPSVHTEARKTARLTTEQYRELVDSIDSYTRLRALAEQHSILHSDISISAKKLEEFVHQNRRYRVSFATIKDAYEQGLVSEQEWQKYRREEENGSLNRLVLGESRPLSRLDWLNAQVRLFDEEGSFAGDCGNTTNVQMGLHKAIGIAPLSLQRYHLTGMYVFNHNFTSYYNPLKARWFSVQSVPYQSSDPYTAAQIQEFYLHVSIPRWHHWKRRQGAIVHAQNPPYFDIFFPGERAPSSVIHRSLTEGWTAEHFERIVLSETTQTPGSIFSTQQEKNTSKPPLSLVPGWTIQERMQIVVPLAAPSAVLFPSQADKVYKEADIAFKAARYIEAAALLDQLPLDYKPYPAQWFRAASHARSGQETKAIAILETSLLQAIITDNLTPAYHYLFHLLGSLLSTQGPVPTGLWWLQHSQDFYQRFSPQIAQLYNDTDRAVRIFYTNILYQAAMDALSREDCAPQEAIEYLERALSLSPYEVAHKNTYLDTDVLNLYKTASEFLLQRSRNPSEQILINSLGGTPPDTGRGTTAQGITQLRFQAFALEELKVQWQGKLVHNYMDDTVIDSFKKEFRVFARLYYFFSDSKLHIFQETQRVQARIQSLDFKAWENYVEGASPEGRRAFYMPNVFSAGKALALAQWQARNTADAMIFIYPMKGLPYIAIHAPPRLEYAPGLYGATRFMIHLHDDAAKRHIALVHEFFHSVEFIFNPPRTSSQRPPLVPHVFQAGNEALRPPWYAGEAELRYYQLAFQNVVSSMNLQRLRLSAQSDSTREETIAAAFP